MPPPILDTQYFPSVSAPITPIIHLYPQEDDLTCGQKQRLDSISVASDHHWTAPFRDGLPTPPNDMTGVAYNPLPSSSYGGKLNGITLPPYAKPPSYPRMNLDSSSAMMPSIKPQSQPSSSRTAMAPESTNQKKTNANSVAFYLQIPPTINTSKGSLAEFAAQMTCLFWFESTAKLKVIEDQLEAVPSLVPEAFPTAGFQKWVTNILSTTQVSQNVILLALMFVYRLKKFNPGVRGKKGSEFRLMTIALMLGNKFLDDNTYTNKTWAEVSGISVQEIHIMEVEFLSNVRYNLFASEEEWARWHTKLGTFSNFFNKAALAVEQNEQSMATPLLRISPNLGPTLQNPTSSPTSKLPSPPINLHSEQAWGLPMNGSSYTAPPPPRSEIQLVSPRKRTRDESVEEHPSKRLAMPNMIPMASTLPPSSALTSIPPLPPVLTPTSVPSTTQGIIPGPVSRLPRPNFTPSSHTLVPSIPTSVPQIPCAAGRALSSVYAPPTNWIPPMALTTAVPPITTGIYNTPISLPDPGRHHNSPFGVSSATVSPAVSAYSVHTPQTHLSPSFFLANRNSPYRPVRTVSTLLIPPPSTSLQQQRTVPFDHMHYQPLGKTVTERKTGLLPYLHHEAWPQGQFVQPNFHLTPNFSG